MKYIMFFAILVFPNLLYANIQDLNSATETCMDNNSSLSDKLYSYVYLTNNSREFRARERECEDIIVEEIFKDFEQRSYLDKLSKVNDVYKEHPVNICGGLALAIRAEWEQRYLPLLSTKYFEEYKDNNAITNIYASSMALLIFENPISKRLAKIANLAYKLALASYITTEVVTNRDMLTSIINKKRFSMKNVPSDPALTLECGTIGSLEDGVNVANMHALGMKLENELAAQFTSMGLIIVPAISILKRAELLGQAGKTINNVKKGLSIGAIFGPQVLLFAGSLVAYEGMEAGIEYYISRQRRMKFESDLLNSISKLEESIKSLEDSLSNMPDNFYSILDSKPILTSNVENMENKLEDSYVLSREVMQGVYNLIGFYNAPILEKTMQLHADLEKIQTFKVGFIKRQHRDFHWIETAYNKIQADLSLSDGSYPTYREFQTSTDSNRIDADKVIRAYNKWQDAVSNFESEVSQIRLSRQARQQCIPKFRETPRQDSIVIDESYRHGIYRTGLIHILQNKKTDVYNDLYKSLDPKTLEVKDELHKIASRMVDRNHTSNSTVLSSVYSDVDRAIRHAGQTTDRNRLNYMRLGVLQRHDLSSKRAWHDSFRQGHFCRNANALLYQASRYFSHLNHSITSLYRNKMNVGFFGRLAKRINADISKNEAFENDMREKMMEGAKEFLKNQKTKSRGNHGGSM